MNSPAVIPHAQRQQAKLETIRNAVISFYRTSKEDIESRARTEPLSTQRHVAMYLCRELTLAPFSVIAEFFQRTDHGTTLHAHQAIEKRMTVDGRLVSEVVAIRAQCRQLLMKEDGT